MKNFFIRLTLSKTFPVLTPVMETHPEKHVLHEKSVMRLVPCFQIRLTVLLHDSYQLHLKEYCPTNCAHHN